MNGKKQTPLEVKRGYQKTTIKKNLKPLKFENYSQYWFTCINHYLLEKAPKNQRTGKKMFRMNTRVLLEMLSLLNYYS